MQEFIAEVLSQLLNTLLIFIGVPLIVLVFVLINDNAKKRQLRQIHREQTPQRQAAIRKFVRELSGPPDWDYIADILNNAGFKNRRGRKITAPMVQKEYAAMLAQEIKLTTKP